MTSRSAMLVGAFPPPVHGLSIVNAAVRDQLEADGVRVTILNLSSGTFSKSAGGRIAKGWRVLSSMARLLSAPSRPTTVYIGLSGGLGQLYDAALVLAARLRRFRIVMHHHSFRYLSRPKFSTRMLVKAGGFQATHVVLCDCMAEKLHRLYKRDSVVVSNAAFLGASRDPRPRKVLRTVGFLSNISEAKGIFRYLEVMKQVLALDDSLQGVIAGQFLDEAVRPSVMEAVAAHPRITYIGPRYGAEKDRFFEEVELLLFPSTHLDEAEPLTVHEAMKKGLPAVCVGRGCLEEVIGPEAGLVVEDPGSFVSLAVERIVLWARNPTMFHAASLAALRRAQQLAAEAVESRNRLRLVLTEP